MIFCLNVRAKAPATPFFNLRIPVQMFTHYLLMMLHFIHSMKGGKMLWRTVCLRDVREQRMVIADPFCWRCGIGAGGFDEAPGEETWTTTPILHEHSLVTATFPSYLNPDRSFSQEMNVACVSHCQLIGLQSGMNLVRQDGSTGTYIPFHFIALFSRCRAFRLRFDFYFLSLSFLPHWLYFLFISFLLLFFILFTSFFPTSRQQFLHRLQRIQYSTFPF